MDIPIVTYTQAMRIADMYSMDDIQVAIAKIVHTIPPGPPQDLDTAILRLAFVAEFPKHFTKSVAIKVFTQASLIHYRPTAYHIMLLIPHPAFVALMMLYREGIRDPDTASRTQKHGPGSWLDREFDRFAFKDSSPKSQLRWALEYTATRDRVAGAG